MTPSSPINRAAAEPIDERDIDTLHQLAGLYDELDPVPTGLVERIQFGITLDALHAEIADLQRSSDLVGARSNDATQAPTVTFTSTSLTTMVTVTPISADRVRIDGWAAPGGGIDIELRVVGGSLHTVADEDGRFVFDDVPRGFAQFLLRPPAASGRQAVITPSIEL